MADVDAESCQCEDSPSNGKVGSGRKSNNFEKGTRHGRDGAQKTWLCVRPTMGVEQNVEQKPEIDHANFQKKKKRRWSRTKF